MVVDDATTKIPAPITRPPSFLKRIASYTNQRAKGITSPLRRTPSKAPHKLDITKENDYRRPSQNVRYYIEKEGFRCDSHNVTTRDGFILRLERILPGPNHGKYMVAALMGSTDQSTPTREKPPIILMHGMFQSAGVWVTSGRKSFAFYLAENGYDVWVANNRTACQEAEKQHVFLQSNEAEFWNWCLDDLAGYDVPAVIEGVRQWTGWEKVGYIGHSQGNAQMFMALKIDPSLNSKLSCFVALAPAVYIGPLLDAFPVNQLVQLPTATHRTVFGTKQFLPIMTFVQKFIPAELMSALSYHMFHFLFDWGDRNWNPTHKTHYFQFTPRPQSAKLLHQWAQIGRARAIRPFCETDEPARTREDGEMFDVGCIRCPLALYYGTRDAIVDARKLHLQCWETSQREEGGHVVDLVAVEEVEGYEHLDCLWATNAEEKVWRRVVRVFEGVGWE
ncbi:Alpha/Beta hydrolase protein [Chytriomyces sp. MP71]|nr:Alpha/Beta hydrolase protein [Chytriomyces sp. MP71]